MRLYRGFLVLCRPCMWRIYLGTTRKDEVQDGHPPFTISIEVDERAGCAQRATSVVSWSIDNVFFGDSYCLFTFVLHCSTVDRAFGRDFGVPCSPRAKRVD